MHISADNREKFYKVRPLFSAVRNRCLQQPLEEKLSVNEAMILFTGWFSVKQRTKCELVPWGIKVLMLCRKNLCAYDFMLYHGVTAIFDESLLELFDQSPSVAFCLAIKATSECTTSFSSTIYFLHTSSPRPPRGWNFHRSGTRLIFGSACHLLSPLSLFALLFDREDKGDMFPRKDSWFSMDYTALYTGGQNSSKVLL
jgi:hypothetical protein